MGLVSAIVFDPESGKRLPTYLKVDLEKMDRHEAEAGTATDELPLEVPDCFRRALPLSDCFMNYDFFTGEAISPVKRAALHDLGKTIEQLMNVAIARGTACSEFGDSACLSKKEYGNDEQEDLVRGYLAAKGHHLPTLLEATANSQEKIPKQLLDLCPATFYDFSPSFPTGFGYALFADGSASGGGLGTWRAIMDQLDQSKK
jgi:hypothetical protein